MTKAEKIELLRATIDASGLPDRRWAEEIAWRDERTVRRWLKGDRGIPAVVLRRLRVVMQRQMT